MAENNSQHHSQSEIGADNDEHYISKSQAKRNVEALQNLGSKLVKLSKNSLDKFELDERLKDEILFAQTIRSHSAHRRQMQLIGKLMRHVDADDILRQYERYQNQIKDSNARFHDLENWRDRLLSEGDPAINELLHEYPDFDRTRLRQLFRNAQKEFASNKPPKSARQLFQYLKEVMADHDE